MDTLEAREVRGSELDQLRDFINAFPESPLTNTLTRILCYVSEGLDVAICPVDDDVTPAQASRALRMSRPHVYKLLDEGVLPFHQVGRDRRIRMRDLAAFVEARDAARIGLAEDFANIESTRRQLAAEIAGVPDTDARRLGF